MYDDDKAGRKEAKAFIELLAEGMKTASEQQLREAASTAILATIQNLDVKAMLGEVLKNVYLDEFNRLKQTPEFKEAVTKKVQELASTAVYQFRLEQRHY